MEGEFETSHQLEPRAESELAQDGSTHHIEINNGATIAVGGGGRADSDCGHAEDLTSLIVTALPSGSAMSTLSSNDLIQCSPIASSAAAAMPALLREALVVYYPLAKNIAANRNVDDKLPVQKRLIANIMNRTEIDKKELSRREALVKRLLAQKDSLSSSFSFASIQATLLGNQAECHKKLQEELLTARNSLEKIRKQVNDISDRLLTEIKVLESMDEQHTKLSKWRKELVELMDKTFEEDKDDIALRLRIMSSKSNYASALDQMDRHKAAEGELKVAKKLFSAALTLLNLLVEKDSEIPDWFRAKFIFDAKQLTTQADLFIQNAYSIDTTLPDQEAIPPPPPNPISSPSLSQTLVHTLRHCATAKLTRIATTNAYIQAAKSTTSDTMERAKDSVKEAQAALNEHRISVMETALEICRAAGGNGLDNIVFENDDLDETRGGWMIPVEGVGDIELRNRPTPGPMRIVNAVPTAPEVLPEYVP
ncbi:hypothetical protein HK100_009412 [Physocladia obscura]|uniref:Uncharacterized protein n=1 Tax=Physocladia obscura TaxID=109957 RepID=A0AAD5T399_9FUNG|nr:hypothetical protein HK100_009412 [Physocladia obscura]